MCIIIIDIHQIYTRDPRPPIPLRVMALSAMGLFGFLLTKCAKTNAKQMRPRSSCAMRRFTRVYLYAQTAVDASDEPWVFWLREKLEDPQFEPHAGIKIAQVLGSLVYIYGYYGHLLNGWDLQHIFSIQSVVMLEPIMDFFFSIKVSACSSAVM